jgi:hypothetical protein
MKIVFPLRRNGVQASLVAVEPGTQPGSAQPSGDR